MYVWVASWALCVCLQHGVKNAYGYRIIMVFDVCIYAYYIMWCNFGKGTKLVLIWASAVFMHDSLSHSVCAYMVRDEYV
jgi:hypothetical protein